MSDVFVQSPPGELLYTFDWSADVPNGVTISTVSYTVPSPLTQFVDSPDLVNKKSTIGIKGVAHAGRYQIDALATLSSGEKIPKALVVRGFNAGM